MLALTSLVLAAGWSFSVDGTLANLAFTPLPGGGAVVTVQQVPLLLDEPRRWDFVVERDEAAGVTRVLERGELVGVSLWAVRAADNSNSLASMPSGEPEPEAPPDPPPAFTLTAAQAARLRGVAFTAGAVVSQPLLDALVPARTCLGAVDPLALGGEGVRDARPPSAPRGLACVVLQRALSVDVSAARFLHAERGLDAAELQRARKVEVLRLVGSEVPWEVVATLPALRELDTRWPQAQVKAVTFPTLEVLRVDETLATDFSALQAPRLKTLLLNGREVHALPAKLPALVTAAINAPLVGDDGFQAFATAHPGASLERGWLGLLKFEVVGLDGVRVRSGGVSESQRSAKVLADVRKPGAAAQLLSSLAVADDSLGFCSCGGGPTLQFLKGDLVLAEVGLQHGAALRWRWPADARLTDDRLPKLLATWGVSEPLERWVESAPRRDAQARRRAAYATLLPRALVPHAMESSLYGPDLSAELKKLEGKGLERLAFYLRLLGTAVPGLEASAADPECAGVLSKAKPTELASLAARTDAQLDAGLRRWLFHYEVPALVGSAALAPHLSRLALQEMVSPESEREQALASLASAKGPGPTAALRAVLASDAVRAEDREGAALRLVQRRDAASRDAARTRCAGRNSAACVEVLKLLTGSHQK